MISIVAASFVSLFLIAVATIVCIIYGYTPNVLLLIYMIIAVYCFIIAFTRFTSAICTVVPDFTNLLGIAMQLFFWFTPIIWNLDMVSQYPELSMFMRCTPFTYLVTGFRQVFIGEEIITAEHGLYTAIFWGVTLIIFIWGNAIFKRNKKDFADVL